jgi:hypothetical protein
MVDGSGPTREELAERLQKTIDQLRSVQDDLVGLLGDIDREQQEGGEASG